RVLSRIYLRDWEERAFRRVDFFSSPIPGDYDRLRERLPQLRARYTQLNYGSVEATIDVGPKSITGSNILVGNSADWANNHAEAFLSLRGVDLGSGKLVVPLSYGDPACREAVIKLGSATFGDRFAPVLELLPLEKYHELIATCAVAVMNHVRQQALGNVEAMLFKGARVFVRPESPVYSFLRERGACIGDASKIEGAGGSLFEPLTADERLRNRRVVESFWGQDVVLGNIAALGSLRRTGAARP
ncbi:MAG TPA: TDP-N-acetylfucosamine:lipid II N-acetylfucosaminyltransferase, partial [Elusimicrobiota bacterium]|nr:TDP-N-acetylfucosamine:lipid II N-acetylfucosaminyltransferase [Elusimicrobiota bacterium]